MCTRSNSLLALTWCLLLSAVSPVVHGVRKFIDMTYPVDENMVLWPGDKSFNRWVEVNDSTTRGYWYSFQVFKISTHAGTHMDAPFHFRLDGWKLEDIPIERFILPAVVVDVSEKADTNADYRLSAKDLMNWEKKYGRIPDSSIVIANFGWAKYERTDKYFGMTNKSDWTSMHFPGIGGDAAKWLVDNRDIWAVGVDTYSTEYGQATAKGEWDAHWTLFSKNIYAIEKLANVDQLPPKGATLYVSPIKVMGADGCPVRAIAILPNTSGTRALHEQGWITVVSVLVLVLSR